MLFDNQTKPEPLYYSIDFLKQYGKAKIHLLSAPKRCCKHVIYIGAVLIQIQNNFYILLNLCSRIAVNYSNFIYQPFVVDCSYLVNHDIAVFLQSKFGFF